jgi:hypothetical protein
MGRNNRRRNNWSLQLPVGGEWGSLHSNSQTPAAVTQVPLTPPISPGNMDILPFVPPSKASHEGIVAHNSQALSKLSLSSNGYRYRNVYAVLFRWFDGDLNDYGTVNNVGSALLGFCYAGVHIHSIPSSDPFTFVEDVLHAAKKRFSSADDLIIVYYSGHGYLNQRSKDDVVDSQVRCMLPPFCAYLTNIVSSKDVEQGLAVDWYALQVGLERHKSDVLILLAACESCGSLSAVCDDVLPEGGMTD